MDILHTKIYNPSLVYISGSRSGWDRPLGDDFEGQEGEQNKWGR